MITELPAAFDWPIGRAISDFWSENSDLVIAGSGLFLLALLALTTRAFAKSSSKAQVIDRISSILVLAWTSEGMWEVVTAEDKLDLPVELAIVTFFFAEAMILSAAMDAEAYRRKHGHPGPYARLVWLLTILFMLVVFAGADTMVEHVFRLVVPLAAVTKWATRMSVEWDTDTDEIKAKRLENLAAREATWVITPRALLIRWGLMKPGETTTTAAQLEHQIQRMVQLADSIDTMGKWQTGMAKRRFRKLARTLTQDTLDEVQKRLAITGHALTLIEGPAGAQRYTEQLKARADELAAEKDRLSAELSITRERAEHEREQAAEQSLSAAEHARREHELSARLELAEQRARAAEQAAEQTAEHAREQAREHAERTAQMLAEQAAEHAEQIAMLAAERSLSRPVSAAVSKVVSTASVPEQPEQDGPVSDEVAVQRMLSHSRDPEYKWTYRSAAAVGGFAQARAQKLIPLWREQAVSDRLNADRAVLSDVLSNAEQAAEQDREQAAEQSAERSAEHALSTTSRTAEQSDEQMAEHSLSKGTDGAELPVSTQPAAAREHVNGTVVAAR